jgi:calcineurin-like phosphoesterase family protein
MLTTETTNDMSGRHLFTADNHFQHLGIIEHCSRPFSGVAEMDATMIENWNAVVNRDDTVWVIGDFGHDRIDPRIARRIFSQLRGSKHLIKGNHDGKVTEDLGWSSVRDYAEIAVDKTRIVLSHYSLRTWNGMRRGAVQLYGHSHGRLPGTGQCADVGVDAWDFRPVSFPEIRQRLATLPPLHFADDTDEVDGLEIPSATP